jgi:hypothetical protein
VISVEKKRMEIGKKLLNFARGNHLFARGNHLISVVFQSKKKSLLSCHIFRVRIGSQYPMLATNWGGPINETANPRSLVMYSRPVRVTQYLTRSLTFHSQRTQLGLIFTVLHHLHMSGRFSHEK